MRAYDEGSLVRQVFISYRRADTGVLANELAESIRSVFGRRAVFIDTGDIAAGTRWADVVNRGLEGMACVLCLVGPNWAGPAEAGRRIDDPDDWVRREIRTAIDGGIPVLPLVADHADIPAARELPEDLRPILEVEALRVETSITAVLETLIDWLAPHLVRPIRFVDSLMVDEDSVAQAGEAFVYRTDQASLFAGPMSERETLARIESDRRACLVPQPVEWSPSLIANIRRPRVPTRARANAMDLLRSIERRLTAMWVGLVWYAGPPFPLATPTRAAARLLGFAALHVLHSLPQSAGEDRDIRPPLKGALRWQEEIDRFFPRPEEISEARVTHVSGINVLPEQELSIYGPRSLVERAYEDRRVGTFQEMTTSWYGEYFAPQLELMLGAARRGDMVRYDGRLSIRKIVNLQGDDLPI